MIEAHFHPAIADIPREEWDALRPDTNPFLSHAFLHTLEATGCIRDDWGWHPHHLALREHGRLIAAAPLYLKGNSHGEFVFDWSWAGAWERAGGDYYPKLLNAVPYSPVPGPRLLAGAGPDAAARRLALAAAMQAEVERLGLSSAHANFLTAEDLAAFDDKAMDGAWLARTDVQFHWHNRGYRDFAEFLAALSHKKRKNIRQERNQVAGAGLDIAMRGGAGLDDGEWRRIHDLYQATFDAKGNHAALTGAFFRRLGRALGDAVQVATAARDGEILAMALFLESDDTLYGRYWGASEEIPGLHFELCYYRGIEHAIARGLARFEPGAQGEHKLARGFLPALTHSRHFLADRDFRAAVQAALARERPAVEAYRQDLLAHSPYAER